MAKKLNTNGMQTSHVRLLSEGEAAWIGAMIEAEGSVMPRITSSRKDAPICEINISNTDVEIISTILRFVGDGTIALVDTGVNKPIWRWRLSKTASVCALAPQIIPWMTTKGSRLIEVLPQLRARVEEYNAYSG